MFDFEDIEKELAELSLAQKSATDELIDIAEPIVKDKQLRVENQMLFLKKTGRCFIIIIIIVVNIKRSLLVKFDLKKSEPLLV